MTDKKTFKIGELSKLFGIGVDSIRYYEEVGILQPERNPENNYRLYTVDDIRRLTLIRELLGLNFSTEQIREYDKDRNIDTTLSLLNKELDIVDEEIKRLEYTKKSIQNRIHTISRHLGKHFDEEVCLLNLPKRGCIMVNKNNLPDNYVDYYLIKYMQGHGIHVNTIGACDCYTLDLPGSNPASLYYKTKNVFFYATYFPPEECNYYLPAGKYLSLIYRGDLTKTKKLMPKMFSYAEKNGLTICGEPVEMCHIDNYETDNENEYIVELQIPVC